MGHRHKRNINYWQQQGLMFVSAIRTVMVVFAAVAGAGIIRLIAVCSGCFQLGCYLFTDGGQVYLIEPLLFGQLIGCQTLVFLLVGQFINAINQLFGYHQFAPHFLNILGLGFALG
jgi:hypothetical protein